MALPLISLYRHQYLFGNKQLNAHPCVPTQINRILVLGLRTLRLLASRYSQLEEKCRQWCEGSEVQMQHVMLRTSWWWQILSILR
jgi:hypothetical protein